MWYLDLKYFVYTASCSADLSIKLWDFDTFQCVKTLQGVCVCLSQCFVVGKFHFKIEDSIQMYTI